MGDFRLTIRHREYHIQFTFKVSRSSYYLFEYARISGKVNVVEDLKASPFPELNNLCWKISWNSSCEKIHVANGHWAEHLGRVNRENSTQRKIFLELIIDYSKGQKEW